jgi:hypothetical protein
VTYRRWRYNEGDEDRPGVGPTETDVAAELEKLGYSPLTPAGLLRTAARRALNLAETYDATQNAAYLPALDRQLGAVMDEARRAAGPAVLPADPGQQQKPEEISDFEEERKKRRGGGQGQ